MRLASDRQFAGAGLEWAIGPEREDMERRAVLGLYMWTPGTCFRCSERSIPVTKLASILTRAGAVYQIAACSDCVLDLEAERERRSRRLGRVYEAGQLGRDG
ncbi:hypothetical protein HYE82_03450 [Streptomyces sp. BR123]|uniref:hypothetical protein n=1 Tax=Streptomyces sp. BR123 TaxID=2749828 RepID=UPI0015C41524|nr:hypothetical protein [Streptomyces sp. BR123]NXY93477.1 hypothetical protein [Streptomyces sp. BR123]